MTTLIGELRHGNDAAREELLTLVYPELRRIATHYMRQERPGHTLRTTGLVNEMYVRLFGAAAMDWQSRAHFFAAVAREMRHILVDYARARDAKKRPDQRLAISLSQVDVPADQGEEDLLALNEALSRLESIDPRASRVVELRYFTGLSERETAEALGVSIATLKRDWAFARAWLIDQLGSGATWVSRELEGCETTSSQSLSITFSPSPQQRGRIDLRGAQRRDERRGNAQQRQPSTPGPSR